MAKKPRKKREVRPDIQAASGFTFSFVLDGNIPSKKNRVRFGKNGTYHDKTFTEWHKQAMLQLAPQWKINAWISHAKEVSISFTYGTHRAKDLTNCAESIMDLLVDLYILKDDSFQICPCIILKGCYIKDMHKTKIEIRV